MHFTIISGVLIMPFGYDWKCNHCGNQIRTGGLWEFYRDELGLRHPYGHPVPVSKEAIKSGVQASLGNGTAQSAEK